MAINPPVRTPRRRSCGRPGVLRRLGLLIGIVLVPACAGTASAEAAPVTLTTDSGAVTVPAAITVIVSARPTQAAIGQVVSFHALVGTPPPGVQLDYSWSFGDGPQGFGAAPRHVYS